MSATPSVSTMPPISSCNSSSGSSAAAAATICSSSLSVGLVAALKDLSETYNSVIIVSVVFFLLIYLAGTIGDYILKMKKAEYSKDVEIAEWESKAFTTASQSVQGTLNLAYLRRKYGGPLPVVWERAGEGDKPESDVHLDKMITLVGGPKCYTMSRSTVKDEDNSEAK